MSAAQDAEAILIAMLLASTVQPRDRAAARFERMGMVRRGDAHDVQGARLRHRACEEIPSRSLAFGIDLPDRANVVPAPVDDGLAHESTCPFRA